MSLITDLSGVENALHQVNQKIDGIDRLSRIINTAQDNHEVRASIRKEQQTCMDLLKQCDRALSNISMSSQREYQVQQLTQTSLRLKDMVVSVRAKESNFPLQQHAPSTGDLRGFVANVSQLQLQGDDDITILESSEFDVDNDIIRSRNEDLNRAKTKLEYNLEIQKDLGYLFDSQSDSIETSLLLSEKNKKISQDALKHIEEAGRRTNASRIKCFIILGIILGGILVVAGIIAARAGIYAAMA